MESTVSLSLTEWKLSVKSWIAVPCVRLKSADFVRAFAVIFFFEHFSSFFYIQNWLEKLKGVMFDFLRFWRPSSSKIASQSTLSILDTITIATDKSARQRKVGLNIDLLAQQQLEIYKSRLSEALALHSIVRFRRPIASFSAFSETNKMIYFSNSQMYHSLVRYRVTAITWK